MKLLRKGKVKEVYEVGDEELEFYFTDNISVFDKVIPSKVPHKGETLCRSSAHWFKIAEKMGIKTHFLGNVASNRMRVKRVKIIEDYSKIGKRTTNYLIPIEWVCRYYVAGSLYDRIKSRETRPEDLGFEKRREIRYGDKIPRPSFEYTTKLEKVDRKLSKAEVMKISGLTEEEFEELRGIVLKIDERIARDVESRGLIHVDGKKEFGFDEDRELMIVDTLGTADEDRFWDLEEYKKGRCIELSKEFVRQYYRSTGYYDKLSKARKEGRKEPGIPALPPDMLEKVSNLYVDLYQKITGERF